MFLKRKRCGKIKGHGCADGHKQRAYTNKSDSTAPTVSTEAVFLTAVIMPRKGGTLLPWIFPEHLCKLTWMS